MSIRTLSISGAAVAVFLAAGAAHASIVYDTSLANVNGPYGAGNASTTTDAHGTVTTVTGPGGNANRANAPFSLNTWAQHNVGGNASVGITDTYARSGNGSLQFTGQDGASKADLENYFLGGPTLASFGSASYDWYRSSTSTTNDIQLPSLRLYVTNGVTSGTLIFEPYYQGQSIIEDSWQTTTFTMSSVAWAKPSPLAHGATASCDSAACFDSLANFSAVNQGLFVTGYSTGIGSGWSGSFNGAVDNVAFTFGGQTSSFNFEVADRGGAVPEPTSWALMLMGFGGLGAMLRRARRTGAVATA